MKATLNGTDVGDINHSEEFSPKYRPFVAAGVNRSLSNFFKTRLEKTGFKPPVNLQAAKGINYHRTRQFTYVVAIVPGSPTLITFIYMGQPVVKQHDGLGIANNIVEQQKSWNIQGIQMDGGSFPDICQACLICQSNSNVPGILCIKEVYLMFVFVLM